MADEMPSPSDVRAVLREHGKHTNERGRLSAKEKADYEAIRGDGATPPEDTYDESVGPDDFSTLSEAADPPMPAERKPRKVKAATPTLRERLTAAKPKPGTKAKKRHPRVPVDRLIGRAWEIAGGLVSRVDVPVGRCLVMQAPVAGLIMEDLVKGTFADRALQPVARAEEKAEKALALIAPPLCVAAIEMAQRLPEDQRKMREAIAFPMLVESMVLWERIAGDKIEEMIERSKQESPARERAEQLALLLLTGPVEQPEQAAAA